MSRINTKTLRTLKNATFTICLLMLVTLSALPAVAFEDNWCDVAMFRSFGDFRKVASSSIWRGHGAVAGGKECFTVDLPSSGSLIFEISVPGMARAQPVIHFLGQRCDDPVDRHHPFRFRERYANRLELDIFEAGQYSFCVSAQDPDEILEDYRIASAFQPERFEKNEDPDEHEPDAEPLDGGHQKSEDPDEHEPDAGAIGPLPQDLASKHPLRGRLCNRQHTDDHGDTFQCATSIVLSESVSAEIRNDWSDDQDMFVFRVEGLSTVYIEMISGSDLLAILYDRFGNRLGRNDDPLRASRSRIVKTLNQGWYFIRVEGRFGAEGGYRLTTENLDP